MCFAHANFCLNRIKRARLQKHRVLTHASFLCDIVHVYPHTQIGMRYICINAAPFLFFAIELNFKHKLYKGMNF